MRAHGNFPDVVFRSFDKIEFAEDFISGNVRFANCRNYLNITDSRKDTSEGSGFYLHDSKPITIGFCTNSIFIQCFHRTLEAALATNHGKYVVQLNNPVNLAVSITNSLNKLPHKFFGGVEGVNISYEHGQTKAERLSSYNSSRLTYSQKPLSYAHEQEFRFVLITEQLDIDHLIVPAAQNSSYEFVRHYA
ncbi:hypothetical protein L7E50_004475 [Vibrio parahaemolyticus]|nr:hypothetical protein [Vibrio parahaemolyticus]